ncbi:hypothetical protein FJW08_27730 [Mesorhizobium sp. B3-2-1]|nr:hypothetical protein FJW08_27730 [Mesorhizobium sp. B3-2-1]
MTILFRFCSLFSEANDMDHIVRLDSRQEAALHAIADKFVATHEGDVIAGRVRPTHRLGNTGSPRALCGWRRAGHGVAGHPGVDHDRCL